MIIYYPTYYLVPVLPVISIDEDEYLAKYDDDDYNTVYNNEYGFRFNMEENQVDNSFKNMDEDIFKEVDQEYVIECTKK